MGDGVVMDTRGHKGRQIEVGWTAVCGEVQGVLDPKNAVLGNSDPHHHCVGHEGPNHGPLQRIRSLQNDTLSESEHNKIMISEKKN